jgi:hypothetical protein
MRDYVGRRQAPEQAAMKCRYWSPDPLIPGHRPDTLDHALEANTQRVRHLTFADRMPKAQDG